MNLWSRSTTVTERYLLVASASLSFNFTSLSFASSSFTWPPYVSSLCVACDHFVNEKQKVNTTAKTEDHANSAASSYTFVDSTVSFYVTSKHNSQK